MEPTKGLEPIDVYRCQAEKPKGSFMTMGNQGLERCSEVPELIAIEIEPQDDNIRGGMSLCSECAKVLIQQIGKNNVVFQKINRKDKQA